MDVGFSVALYACVRQSATRFGLNGADTMRHLARRLAASFRFDKRLNRDDLRPGTLMGVVDLAIAVLPIVVVLLLKLFGAHVGIALYAQVWVLPLVIGAIRWGMPAALAVGAVGLAAMDPAATRLVLGSSAHLSTADWVAQTGLITLFAVSVGLRATRGRNRGKTGWNSGGARSAEAVGQLRDADRVLASLANTVEIRDHHTRGHCRRVARNAVVVGKALGLNRDELWILHWAATLHDLGKIAVPEYILLKTGRLSEEEYAEIRRHPMYGADLLASVSPTYRPIADVVRAHHERWDGLGYPLGLKGEEIPAMARIIAVVDVFEALTSDRPYRSPMPEAQALAYIKNGAGTQFDPSMVEAFASLYPGGGIECAGSSPTSPARTISTQDSALVPNV